MAIDRTNITPTDDDGTGTTGTVLDAAFFDAIYDAIDAYAALLGPSENIPLFAVAGPTVLRTYTFPDANSTVFTSASTSIALGTNPATAGVIRLANNSGIGFRNAANSANKSFILNTTDQFEFDGYIVPSADNTYELGTSSTRWLRGNFSEAVRIGTNPASTGAARLAHTGFVAGRNNANDANATLLDWGNRANDHGCLGSASFNWRIASNLATPSGLSDGDWWVECTGVSPARVCAIKVRDGGATRTIASMTY